MGFYFFNSWTPVIESMEKIDVRKVSDRKRELLRKQVISLRTKGKKNSEVAELLGLPVETTSRWWQWYLREGKQM